MKPDYGLKIGIVKRPEAGGGGGGGAAGGGAGGGGQKKDPNCVTVSILEGIDSTKNPIYKDVTARVLASFAGSNDCLGISYGSVIIPQNGEQVLVGYLNGNAEGEAYILGSVFQGMVKPPYDITKTKAPTDVAAAGESMFVKFKNETQISINNVSKDTTSMVITTKKGREIKFLENQNEALVQIGDNSSQPKTYLKMDLQNGAIECKATKTITFAAGDGQDKCSIVIDGNSGNIDIKSVQSNVTIDAKQNSTLKCGTNSVAVATQGVEVKGTQAKVEGQSMVKVSGQVVQLG